MAGYVSAGRTNPLYSLSLVFVESLLNRWILVRLLSAIFILYSGCFDMPVVDIFRPSTLPSFVYGSVVLSTTIGAFRFLDIGMMLNLLVLVFIFHFFSN